MIYILLKNKIERKSYKSIEEMKVTLETYLKANRITKEEYEELNSSLV